LRAVFATGFPFSQTLLIFGRYGATDYINLLIELIEEKKPSFHSWLVGVEGTLSALFGFQYRINYEELALKEQFGKEYDNYRARTPMLLLLGVAANKKT